MFITENSGRTEKIGAKSRSAVAVGLTEISWPEGRDIHHGITGFLISDVFSVVKYSASSAILVTSRE
jgi:hypothetical protein